MAIIVNSKQYVYTFHDNTAFDAASEELNGDNHNSQSYEVAVIWAVPSGSYDGTLNFEMSPDNGAVWLATEVQKLEDSTTLSSTFTFSGADTEAFVIVLPEAFKIRMRSSGGTAGNISVYGRIVDGRF